MLALKSATVRKQEALDKYWKAADVVTEDIEKVKHAQKIAESLHERQIFLKAASVKQLADKAGRADAISEDRLWSSRHAAKMEPTGSNLEAVRKASLAATKTRNAMLAFRKEMKLSETKERQAKADGVENGLDWKKIAANRTMHMKKVINLAKQWKKKAAKVLQVVQDKQVLFKTDVSLRRVNTMEQAAQEVKCSDRAIKNSENLLKKFIKEQGKIDERLAFLAKQRAIATKQWAEHFRRARLRLSLHAMRKMRIKQLRKMQMCCARYQTSVGERKAEQDVAAESFAAALTEFKEGANAARAKLIEFKGKGTCTKMAATVAKANIKIAQKTVVEAQKWQVEARKYAASQTEAELNCGMAPTYASLYRVKAAALRDQAATVAELTSIARVKMASDAVVSFRAGEVQCKKDLKGNEASFKEENKAKKENLEKEKKKFAGHEGKAKASIRCTRHKKLVNETQVQLKEARQKLKEQDILAKKFIDNQSLPVAIKAYDAARNKLVKDMEKQDQFVGEEEYAQKVVKGDPSKKYLLDQAKKHLQDAQDQVTKDKTIAETKKNQVKIEKKRPCVFRYEEVMGADKIVDKAELLKTKVKAFLEESKKIAKETNITDVCPVTAASEMLQKAIEAVKRANSTHATRVDIEKKCRQKTASAAKGEAADKEKMAKAKGAEQKAKKAEAGEAKAKSATKEKAEKKAEAAKAAGEAAAKAKEGSTKLKAHKEKSEKDKEKGAKTKEAAEKASAALKAGKEKAE